MPVLKRAFLWWFWGGLAAFAFVLYLHLPLAIDAVPRGIADHQSARDAATVDAIQTAWRSAGLWPEAIIAMVGDLVFIGIYGFGCVLGGLYFRASGERRLSALGWVAYLAGIAFLLTDYTETISQLIQLWSFKGDTGLATIASGVRPYKMAAFVIAFIAIIAALIIERKSRDPA